MGTAQKESEKAEKEENDSNSKYEEDVEEKLILEQMNKDREIEKQYQKQSFIIPSCSAWFDFSTIHELEM